MKLPATLALAGLCVAGGCADDGPSVRARQDAALADPFGYGPDADALATPAAEQDDRHDISGGGVADFDRAAFRRDLDTVLNP